MEVIIIVVIIAAVGFFIPFFRYHNMFVELEEKMREYGARVAQAYESYVNAFKTLPQLTRDYTFIDTQANVQMIGAAGRIETNRLLAGGNQRFPGYRSSETSTDVFREYYKKYEEAKDGYIKAVSEYNKKISTYPGVWFARLLEKETCDADRYLGYLSRKMSKDLEAYLPEAENHECPFA